MSATETLVRAVRGEVLTRGETAALLRGVAAGDVSLEVMAAFLTALAVRGETAEVLTGLVDVARESLVPVPCRATGIIDVCGTGGDGQSTVNISTAAAIVVAGAGIPVAKHGNHAISSCSGSADVLAALGVEIRQTPARVAEAIDQIGLGFIYAPHHHPLFARLGPLRRALGFRTAFNLLGPLCNPAGVRRQLVGVGAAHAVSLLAEVLAGLRAERALVVHTPGPYDEVSLTTETQAVLVEDGRCTTLTLRPSDFGCAAVRPEDLAGGDPGLNARRVLEVLRGAPVPLRRVVCANAACALLVAGAAEDVGEGYQLADEAIGSGAAWRVLLRLRAFTHGLAMAEGAGGLPADDQREDNGDVMVG